MAACLSWTNAENLPVSFVDRIFQTYVRPSACFGLEFLTGGSQLKRFQVRLLQWGKRLLMWPQGAPGIVVQGQLAWHSANTSRFVQAASLWARLGLPHNCFAAQLARFASAHSRSWLSSLGTELSAAGVQHPFNWGIHAGCSQQLVTRRLRSVKQILHRKFCAEYVQEVRNSQSLGNFLLNSKARIFTLLFMAAKHHGYKTLGTCTLRASDVPCPSAQHAKYEMHTWMRHAALYIHTPLCVHRFQFVLLMLLVLVFDDDASCCYANGALQSFSL